MNDSLTSKPMFTAVPTLEELSAIRGLYSETYPVRPLLNEIDRLRVALANIARLRLRTDCGIDPMRAAGMRQGFETAAEEARKALGAAHETDAEPKDPRRDCPWKCTPGDQRCMCVKLAAHKTDVGRT